MIRIPQRGVWTWKELAFVCPKGHGEYVTTNKKEIFNVVKTGLFYCPECQESYRYTNGTPKTQ